MRQLLNNLSIKSKILLGFFILTAIYFVLGIYQYNALEKVNTSNQAISFAKDMNTTSAQIKYLLAKDMLVLRNFHTAKNEKELKSLHKEHLLYHEKLKEVFASVAKLHEINYIDKNVVRNYRDTILTIERIYDSDYTISYNEIHLAQKISSTLTTLKTISANRKTPLSKTNKLSTPLAEQYLATTERP